ncbi:PASTA domain-containing protein [Nocardioides sp. P5_C9_2]
MQLVVSRGPELVEVPRVVAKGVDAATEELEALGFVVEVEESSNYIGVGFVFSSDPGAGSMAPKGSTITLYLI